MMRVIPLGDIGIRHTCVNCGTLHYKNPNIVAGCVAVRDGRVLLCRRAIEPFSSLWTVPAGYVELGETVEEAAVRETREESGAQASNLQLCALYNLTTFGEVYLLYRATITTAALLPGPETLEAGLFRSEEIPWRSIAFPMVREALMAWSRDPSPEAGCIQTLDFLWGPEGAVRVRRHNGSAQLRAQHV